MVFEPVAQTTCDDRQDGVVDGRPAQGLRGVMQWLEGNRGKGDASARADLAVERRAVARLAELPADERGQVAAAALVVARMPGAAIVATRDAAPEGSARRPTRVPWQGASRRCRLRSRDEGARPARPARRRYRRRRSARAAGRGPAVARTARLQRREGRPQRLFRRAANRRGARRRSPDPAPSNARRPHRSGSPSAPVPDQSGSRSMRGAARRRGEARRG